MMHPGRYLPVFFACLIFRIGFAQSSIDSLDVLLKNATGSKKVSLLLKKAELLVEDQPQKAIAVASDAFTVAQQEKSGIDQAQALLLSGRAYASTGKHFAAIQSLTTADTLFSSLKEDARRGETKIYLSNSLNGQGKYQLALKAAMDANRIFTRLGDQTGIGRSLISVGLSNYNIKNYSEAKSNYRSALNVLLSNHELAHAAKCYNNLGNVYKAQNDPDSALIYLDKSLAIKKQIGNKASTANTLNTIGSVYHDMRDFDKAASYYLEALDLRKQLGDEKEMAKSYFNLGSLKQSQDESDKAIDYYRRANELARKTNSLDVQLDICYNLGELYYNKEEFQLSADQYIRADSLNSVVYNTELAENTAQMQAQFNVEKAMQSAESEKQKREEANRRTLYIIIAASVVVVIVSTLMFVLYRQSQIRRRINSSLKQQKKEIEQKNSALQQAYGQIEEKNKDITDSIRYAKRIQQAVLPSPQLTLKLLPEHFVFFRPKDIVSGDFYWVEQWSSQVLVGAADCTGHGVPGALMSVMGHNLLSQSVNVYGLSKPNLVLNHVNKALSKTLHQHHEDPTIRDGMDIALISIDLKKLTVEFSGANNPLWIVRNGEIIEYKGDKQPIGNILGDEVRMFTNHEITLQPGDKLYLFTDGFADQFGGPDAVRGGKKFKRSGLRDLLLRISNQPMHRQKQLMEDAFDRWRGELEQVDDVLVIGIAV